MSVCVFLISWAKKAGKHQGFGETSRLRYWYGALGNEWEASQSRYMCFLSIDKKKDIYQYTMFLSIDKKDIYQYTMFLSIEKKKTSINILWAYNEERKKQVNTKCLGALQGAQNCKAPK